MKLLVVAVVALFACSKKTGDAPATGSAAGSGSGSATAAAPAPAPTPAAPVEDVSCKDAAKAYVTKMAQTPGNVLSDASPNEGLIHYTSISMEDYCVGEDGCCVPWTATERACVQAATPSTVAECFSGAALSQVNAGLTEVVTSALENKKKNDEAAKAGKAAGSATP